MTLSKMLYKLGLFQGNYIHSIHISINHIIYINKFFLSMFSNTHEAGDQISKVEGVVTGAGSGGEGGGLGVQLPLQIH